MSMPFLGLDFHLRHDESQRECTPFPTRLLQIRLLNFKKFGIGKNTAKHHAVTKVGPARAIGPGNQLEFLVHYP